MNKKLVLVVAYNFPPSNTPSAQRPYFMAKYLNKSTDLESLILIPSSPLTPLGNSNWADTSNLNIYYTGSKAESNDKDGGENSGVNVSSLYKLMKTRWINKVFRFISKNFFIPDKGVLWYAKAMKKGKEILENNPEISVIYSTSPSFVSNMIAYALAKKFNKKWVADIRDFFFIHNGEKENLIKRSLIKRMENNIVNYADFVTFVTERMRDEYVKMYPKLSNKSSVIFNGFDPNEFDYSLSRSGRNSSKLKIFYAGSFFEGVRDPFIFLNILEDLIEEQKLSIDSVEISIAGSLPEWMGNRIREMKIGKCVNVLGLIPRKDALRHMIEADLLWLIVGNKKSHYQTIPLKSFEYLGARKHIIVFSPHEAEVLKVIDYANCGTWFDITKNEDAQSGNRVKFLALIDKWKNNLPFSEINEDAILKFNRINQADELASVIRRLL